MIRFLPLAVLAWLLGPACSGGTAGGGDDPETPGPFLPFAVRINPGLAIEDGFARAAVVPPYLLIPVSEIESGKDLNDDRDKVDRVMHLLDTESGEVTNLGLAVTGKAYACDVQFAFLVSEVGQNVSDLNGDGDTLDAVWFVFDPRLPLGPTNPSNTGLATPGSGLPGVGTTGGFVLLQSETSSGGDLNGDGDITDLVIRAINTTTRTVAPLQPMAQAAGTPLVARNGRVLVAISEKGEGQSLNGDADTLDTVLVAVDFTFLETRIVNVGGIFPRAIGNAPYALTDGHAVYFIDEASDANRDLNADGDSVDAILAVFDLGTGTGEVTPRASTVATFALACNPAVGIATGPDRAVVALSEAGNGNRDLNNDLDWFDSVAAWVDTTNPAFVQIVPITFGLMPAAMDGRRAIVPVSEINSSAIIGVDLNGDGDTDDLVAHVIDTSTNTVTNLGVAVTTLAVHGDDALIGVPEAGDLGIDLNGDGDTNDVVLRYCDLGARPISTVHFGLAANAATMIRAGSNDVRLALLAPENQGGHFRDTNQDGDANDNAIVLVRIAPFNQPPAVLAPTPIFAGTASAFPLAPVHVGPNVVAFATSEVMENRDLNNDRDKTDTVIQYVRLSP